MQIDVCLLATIIGETKVIGMHPPEVMVRHKDGTLIPVMLSVR